MATIEIQTTDITLLAVDAIVNAANASLMGGGGVDGAIHRAGGDAILAECKQIRKNSWPEGLPTGKAVVTTAGNMPAKYVIHTVGPIYHNDPNPNESLAACYQNCLALAQENKVKTIAFPSISTGVYGFPKLDAAKIAISTSHAFLQDNPGSVNRVILVAFSSADAEILNTIKAEL